MFWTNNSLKTLDLSFNSYLVHYRNWFLSSLSIFNYTYTSVDKLDQRHEAQKFNLLLRKIFWKHTLVGFWMNYWFQICNNVFLLIIHYVLTELLWDYMCLWRFLRSQCPFAAIYKLFLSLLKLNVGLEFENKYIREVS